MIDPVFGRKDPKLDYHTRIGAYGVIPDHSGARLLILQAPNHALFLPGGGVEEGETPEVTLARELLEEFGATVHVTQKLGKSSDYFYSQHRQTAYYHPATTFACDQLAFVQDPLETFNTLMLMPIDLALAELKRPTHRWAVAKWLANQPKR